MVHGGEEAGDVEWVGIVKCGLQRHLGGYI